MKIKITKKAVLRSEPGKCSSCLFATLAKEVLHDGFVQVNLLRGSQRVTVTLTEGKEKKIYDILPGTRALMIADRFDTSIYFKYEGWRKWVIKLMNPFIGQEFELKEITK